MRPSRGRFHVTKCRQLQESRWLQGWRDWPRGEMRRGNQRKSKSEDQMTSWAPNVFQTGRTLTPEREKGEGSGAASTLPPLPGVVSSPKKGQGN